MADRPHSLLLVDDEEANRLIITRRLQQEGYRVATAEHGAQALDMLRAQAFDLVLLDLYMPELDGEATLIAMKADARLRAIPVVMLTAASGSEQVTRCLGLGAADYLVKPVEPGDLRRRVGRLLGLGAEGPPAAAPADAEAPAAPAGEAGSVIDWAALTQHFANRQDFIRKLLLAVVTSHGDGPARLRTAAAMGDLGQLALLAHTYKGLGGNLKAAPLQRLGEQAETSARAGQADAAALADRLAAAMEQLLATLQARLDETPDS